MKVARLSALRTGRLYPQEIFLVLISFRGSVHSAAGRIMSMKIPMTPSRIDLATFRFDDDDDNNNNNNNNKLQVGCRPVAAVIMHVHKYEVKI
jgi:hypothetical protein